MKDIKLDVLENIIEFVNSRPLEKIAWVKSNPEEAIYIIDYLVNITKDR